MTWAAYPPRERRPAGRPSRDLVELVLLEALSSECHRLNTLDAWYRQRSPYATTLGIIGHIPEPWWDVLGLRSLGRKLGPLVRAGLVHKKKWTYGRFKYQLSECGAQRIEHLTEQLALRGELAL